MAKRKKSKFSEDLTKIFGPLGNEKTRGCMMMIACFVFFGVLIGMIRSGTENQLKNPDPSSRPFPTETSSGLTEEGGIFSSLMERNYNYIYTFETDQQKEMLTGKKYLNKEKFTLINSGTSIEAAKLSDQYLVKKEEKYTFSEMPTQNLRYTKLEELAKILELSEYEEKKEYLSYYIDPIDFFDHFFPDFEYDSFGTYESDTVNIYQEQNQITKIEMQWNHTIHAVTSGKTTQLKITLEYNDIGKVLDFEIN